MIFSFRLQHCRACELGLALAYLGIQALHDHEQLGQRGVDGRLIAQSAAAGADVSADEALACEAQVVEQVANQLLLVHEFLELATVPAPRSQRLYLLLQLSHLPHPMPSRFILVTVSIFSAGGKKPTNAVHLVCPRPNIEQAQGE